MKIQAHTTKARKTDDLHGSYNYADEFDLQWISKNAYAQVEPWAQENQPLSLPFMQSTLQPQGNVGHATSQCPLSC